MKRKLNVGSPAPIDLELKECNPPDIKLLDKLEFDDYLSDCFVCDINHAKTSKLLDRYVALGTVKWSVPSSSVIFAFGFTLDSSVTKSIEDCGSTMVSSVPTIAHTCVFLSFSIFAFVKSTPPLKGAIAENLSA